MALRMPSVLEGSTDEEKQKQAQATMMTTDVLRFVSQLVPQLHPAACDELTEMLLYCLVDHLGHLSSQPKESTSATSLNSVEPFPGETIVNYNARLELARQLQPES